MFILGDDFLEFCSDDDGPVELPLQTPPSQRIAEQWWLIGEQSLICLFLDVEATCFVYCWYFVFVVGKVNYSLLRNLELASIYRNRSLRQPSSTHTTSK
jgi:hypothetical protein